MGITPTCLNNHHWDKTYSICTLVTDHAEYREMLDSFRKAGFDTANSEFLYIDNSQGNTADAYSGLNTFLNLAKGKYIILCHQDILLQFDTLKTLTNRLKEMDNTDPDWAILGNAGFNGFTERFYRISDPWANDIRYGTLPAKVKSLDENFLIVKNDANLALSHDLCGFHMYGSDLCTQASFLGYNAYVIDFHIYHKSRGNCDAAFYRAKQAFIEKYARLMHSLFIRTTCTIMIITPSRFLNRLLNRKVFYSLKKRIERIRSYCTKK